MSTSTFCLRFSGIWGASLRHAASGFAEVDQPGLCDCRVLAHRPQNRFGNLSVEANQGNGFGASGGVAATERKRGDVDPMLAEGGADVADHAGTVFVAKKEHGAVELRLERNAVNLDDAWRAVMQDGALGGEPGAARLVRKRGDFQRVRETMFAAAGFLLHREAASRG